MTIIIPYTDDKRNGTELMYAIRSMVKHFRSMTGLILVGDLPRWYTGDYLPYRDVPLRREYSMYLKAMAGANAATGKFLYTTDDHFALQDFDDTLPNYHLGLCGSAAINKTSGRYKKLYANCPAEWLDYDLHVPIVMSKFNWPSTRLETDTPIKTTYANRAEVEGTQGIDCKFYNGHTYDQIKAVIGERQFFSTSPFCMNAAMLQVLNELYPDKSKYEK